MTNTKLQRKVKDLEHLDSATQEIIRRIDRSDRRLRVSGFITLTTLLVLGVIGIYRQNQLASQNKQHIDCIIKDLATPLPPSSRSKYITNLSTDCKIKFTN